jgi:hypothetical protein
MLCVTGLQTGIRASRLAFVSLVVILIASGQDPFAYKKFVLMP